MSPSPMAVAHATARLRLALAAARAARLAWRKVDRDAPGPSWLAALGPVIAAVAGAQLAAAQSTEPWLEQLLGLDDGQAESDRLNPASLSGVTGDGTPLVQALQVPVWTALRLVTRGVPVVQAMARGQLLLDLMVRTAVADAGRAADSVGMTARPAVTSYVRVVEGGACSRCVVLAGREYGVSAAFARHPRCHCGMEPVTREHRPKPSSPQQLYDAMSEPERKRTFGEAAVKAIDDGADLAQVVNARRGMASATVEGRRLATTTEGSVRGEFRRREFRRLQGEGAIPRSQSIRGFRPERARLMPEEIFRIADDRAHAMRLLRLHGYLY
ncbi:VG15 protein [Streptomyces sp. NPDC002623]